MAAARLRIAGRVQGVGYRAWLAGIVQAQGLRGWVRNRRDGSVEALLIGDPPAIAQVAAACRTGPRLARIDSIDRSPAEDDGGAGFRMLSTI